MRLSWAAHRDLVELLEDEPADLESGGPLFGVVDGSSLEIVEAMVGVREQGPNHAVLDGDAIWNREDHLKQAGIRRRLCGHWHSEVLSTGPGQPSEQDLRSWRSWCEAVDLGFFVGITVRRPRASHLGWNGALTTARVFARDKSDGVVRCVRVIDNLTPTISARSSRLAHTVA